MSELFQKTNKFDCGLTKVCIIALSLIICTIILAHALQSVLSRQSTVTVTGLGETERNADWISWGGRVQAEDMDRISCYRKLEKNRLAVESYLAAHNIDKSSYNFFSVSIERIEENSYSASGNYMGQRFAGYRMTQRFEVESSEIDKVETISRNITSLMKEGVSIESESPKFFLKDISELKLSLIDDATANALVRARKLVKDFAQIKNIRTIDVGVFQITSAEGSDDYTSGGAFNTTDRTKKVSVTVHATYSLK